MKPLLLTSAALVLVACGSIKRPSSDPARMSSDALCYRQAYAKSDAKLDAEIGVRGIDCADILESQSPVFGTGF